MLLISMTIEKSDSMNYIEEYRDSKITRAILQEIFRHNKFINTNYMEICGGHTVAIFKHGLRDTLPANIKLLSGPGCPVCVTDISFIDEAIELAKKKNVIIATFGDMLRVPGSYSSLMKEKSTGADIRICYSAMDSLKIAENNPDKEVVFIGVGFETTAPAIGVTIKTAKQKRLQNFSVLSSHKTMPNAIRALLDADEVAINGFICPGHVSAITGTTMYDFVAKEYNIPCVISGFEPSDILETILMLMKQTNTGEAKVENQYTRGVKKEGNLKALEILNDVFVPIDIKWRGIGLIPSSGLGISRRYSEFDTRKKIKIDLPLPKEISGCICGEIMRGVKTPKDCTLFAKVCNPENPQGACMVSAEGSCGTYYRYMPDMKK